MNKGKLNTRFNKKSELKVENGIEDAHFRLEDQKVQHDVKSDLNYYALQKINNILHGRPDRAHIPDKENENGNDEKKLLFDLLIDELNSLFYKNTKMDHTQSLPTMSKILNQRTEKSSPMKTEQLFLIINDDIEESANKELTYLDPNYVNDDSSIILLGDVAPSVTDERLYIMVSKRTKTK